MPVFPDIAKHGLLDVQFFTHVPDGFRALKGYWQTLGKPCDDPGLWFYKGYTRAGAPHAFLLNIRPSEEGCADIRIAIGSAGPADFGVPHDEAHAITEKQFLGMFEMLLSRPKKRQPSKASFLFRREIRGGEAPILGSGGRSVRLSRVVFKAQGK